MATIYNVNIKTVSPFVSYNEKYIRKMFEEFLKNYRDKDNKLGFENSEIEVEIQR